MVVDILTSKIELFGYFFQFSNVGRLVVNCAWNFKFCLFYFRIFILFWLVNWFLLDDGFCWEIRDDFVLNFTDYSDTFYWVNNVWTCRARLFIFNPWFFLYFLLIVNFWFVIDFWLDFWLNYGLLIFWRFDWSVGLIIWLRCLNYWFLLFLGGLLIWRFDLFFWLSSRNWFHSSSEKEIVHIFFEIWFFSVCV